MTQKKPYRTFAVAKASVFVPTHKAVAQSNDVMEQLGRDTLAQKDLMYVKSVLVTAGVNGNDDVFFVDELWKARKTPILKPLDWKHRDSEIVGVMYSVESYDVASGNLINASAEDYSEAFEIVTEGVVYKLMFPDRAAIIDKSAKAGELFVSMECWFDDYNYVLFKENGEVKRVIARNSDTAFLDASLRAYGGEGTFSDSESGEIYRLGRGLLGLTFGGCGFVPIPANTRSVIISVNDERGNNSATEKEKEDYANVLSDEEIAQVMSIIEKQESIVFACDQNKEVCEMTDVKAEVKKALDETKAQEKAEAERKALEQEAARAGTLDGQKSELEGKIAILNGQHDALITSITDTFQEVIKVVAEAGLPEPGEAKSAEDAMAIKLAWFQKTVATLVEEAKKAKSLQEKFDNIEKETRVESIKALLNDILDEEKVESFIEVAIAMDKEVYDKWFEEKKLLVDSVRAKLEVKDENVEGEAEGETEASAETEEKSEETEGTSETEAAVTEIKEVKDKNSEEAEAAKSDVDLLEDVEVENQPNLAKTSGGEEDEDPTGFKAVAEAVHPSEEEKMSKDNKPGFDPVK